MRELFKKIHLWLSLPLGLIISVICLSGAVLVFEKEITRAVQRESDTVTMQSGEMRQRPKSLPFFQTVRKVHRWLLDPPAAKGEKSVGKVIVGVTTMAMIVVLVSGLVIWIPRSRKALKARLSVSVTKGWKLTWSFGWYREAAYSLTGDMEPQAAKRLFFSLHTGSWGGIVTKILYFIAALAGGLLPLSGYWLWWKRKHRQNHAQNQRD